VEQHPPRWQAGVYRECCCTLHALLATETITTSLAALLGPQHSPEQHSPPEDVSPVPTAISIFGGERVPFPKPPPLVLAERYYDVTSWPTTPRGALPRRRARSAGPEPT